MLHSLSHVGFNLIKGFEGCVLHPYLDTVGVPTIGWGSTAYEDGRRVTMSDPHIDQARADALFMHMLGKYVAGINAIVHVTLTQSQFDALVSLAYNCGVHAVDTYHGFMDALNRGEYAAASALFPAFDIAGGVHNPDLHTRRLKEQVLFNAQA